MKVDNREMSYFHMLTTEKTDESIKTLKAASVTLLQILQTGLLPFQDGAHTTQSGSLQLFTPVQRISVLHQTHIVFGDTGGWWEMLV